MPKYLIQFSYTTEGVKGLLKEGGSSRRAAAQQLVESLGGRLEAYYFALGEADGFAIIDAPDNASIAALSVAVAASGAVHAKTTSKKFGSKTGHSPAGVSTLSRCGHGWEIRARPTPILAP